MTASRTNYPALSPGARREPPGAAHEFFLGPRYEKELSTAGGACSLILRSGDTIWAGNFQGNFDLSHFIPIGFRLVA